MMTIDELDARIAMLLERCAAWDSTLIESREAWAATDDPVYRREIADTCARAQADRVALRIAIRARFKMTEGKR